MLTDDATGEDLATVERLRGLRDLVTTEMGGADAVAAIHAAGAGRPASTLPSSWTPVRSVKSGPSPPPPTR